MPKTHNRDSPRLRFAEEEAVAPEQLMQEVPAAKAAKGKQPKSTPKLSFEESKPKRPSKVVHPIERTVRTAGDQLHRQVAQANEDDNVAVTAALKADDARATVLQEGERAYHARKLRAQRRKAEGRKHGHPAGTSPSATASGAPASGQQSDAPRFTSSPLSRWQQKRAIRREYAAAKAGKSTVNRTGQAARTAEKAVERAGRVTEKAGSFLARHPKLALRAPVSRADDHSVILRNSKRSQGKSTFFYTIYSAKQVLTNAIYSMLFAFRESGRIFTSCFRHPASAPPPSLLPTAPCSSRRGARRCSRS